MQDKIENIINHLKDELDLDLHRIKESKNIYLKRGRLLNENADLYIHNLHYETFSLISKNILLNEKGTILINKKIKNKKLINILNSIIKAINLIQCFTFKNDEKVVYPKIELTIHFNIKNNQLNIKEYIIKFKYHKNISIYTNNKFIEFKGKVGFKYLLNEDFDTTFYIYKDYYKKLLTKLKLIWSDYINLNYSEENLIEYIKQIKKIIEY